MTHLAPIRWNDDKTAPVILDQTRLPEELVEIELETVQDVFDAIYTLKVRGAPLVGITAAMGVAALARQDLLAEPRILRYDVGRWCDYFATARSTPVNLSWALSRMRDVTRDNEDDDTATRWSRRSRMRLKLSGTMTLRCAAPSASTGLW